MKTERGCNYESKSWKSNQFLMVVIRNSDKIWKHVPFSVNTMKTWNLKVHNDETSSFYKPHHRHRHLRPFWSQNLLAAFLIPTWIFSWDPLLTRKENGKKTSYYSEQDIGCPTEIPACKFCTYQPCVWLRLWFSHFWYLWGLLFVLCNSTKHPKQYAVWRDMQKLFSD